jgi:hypothetical protein
VEPSSKAAAFLYTAKEVKAMSLKKSNTERQMKALEAEELVIESKTNHQGFRDASRRNRIEEELNVLQEGQRHVWPSGTDSAPSDLHGEEDHPPRPKGPTAPKE